MAARWPHMAPRSPRRLPQGVQDASRGPQQGPRNLRRHPRTPSRMGLRKKMRTGKDSQGMARTRTKNRKEDEREKDDNKDNVKTKTETRTYALFLPRSLNISLIPPVRSLKDQGAWREAPMQSCIYIHTYMCIYIYIHIYPPPCLWARMGVSSGPSPNLLILRPQS